MSHSNAWQQCQRGRAYWQNRPHQITTLLTTMLSVGWLESFVYLSLNQPITIVKIIHDMLIIGLCLWLSMFGLYLAYELWYWRLSHPHQPKL